MGGQRSSRPPTLPTALCKKRTVNYWMHLRRPFECKTIEESAVSDAVVAPLAPARDGSARRSVSLIRICSHMVQWDIEHCLPIAWEPHALASASRDLSLSVCLQKLFTQGHRWESRLIFRLWLTSLILTLIDSFPLVQLENIKEFWAGTTAQRHATYHPEKWATAVTNHLLWSVDSPTLGSPHWTLQSLVWDRRGFFFWTLQLP